MRGDRRVTDGVARPSTPGDALRLLEQILEPFCRGEQVFLTARSEDSRLSMWRAQSKSTALYWCASALSKLWHTREEPLPEEVPARDPAPRQAWFRTQAAR